MLKRCLLALSLAFAGLSPAFGYGTITYSLTQQFGSDGKPLAGGFLYLYQAGTVATPQNCYQDTGLTIAWPNPITLDSAGRIPQLFCADGSIKVRLTNSAGVTQVVADNILVIGGGGGGGGSTVDATTVLATGDIKTTYGTGTLSGFVRCNGRTIGSATSGASERANSDTSALFVYLWGADANLAVSSGRGASGAADFAANKTLTLPDCRGRVLAGLDDMGSTAASRLTASYFGSTATTLGAANGSESTTLTLAQLPTGITSAGTVTVTTSGGNTFPILNGSNWGGPSTAAASPGAFQAPIANSTVTSSSSLSGSNTLTSNNTSGSAHRTVQPTILMTVYIKL